MAIAQPSHVQLTHNAAPTPTPAHHSAKAAVFTRITLHTNVTILEQPVQHVPIQPQLS